jgi:hypothetical protein
VICEQLRVGGNSSCDSLHLQLFMGLDVGLRQQQGEHCCLVFSTIQHSAAPAAGSECKRQELLTHGQLWHVQLALMLHTRTNNI